MFPWNWAFLPDLELFVVFGLVDFLICLVLDD